MELYLKIDIVFSNKADSVLCIMHLYILHRYIHCRHSFIVWYYFHFDNNYYTYRNQLTNPCFILQFNTTAVFAKMYF